MDFLLHIALILVVVIGAIFLFKFIASRIAAEKPLPYRVKKFFFTRSEQEFLRLLNGSIDRQKYTIFPKVRLADFIEVTTGKGEYQSWWNKIRSKHIDFLVWNVEESRIALAIELDGSSHQSERAEERDEFKNKLYAQIQVPLVRVKTGTDFNTEISKLVSSL